MDELTLILEVGSEALDELSDTEKTAILSNYDDDEVKYAGMKVFDILRKKFLPTYRMGRMYEDLSAKFEKYDRLYKEYCSIVSAGSLAADPDNIDNYDVERWKWVSPTQE